MGKSSTSAGLLERARSHDEDAWTTLVRLYAPLVYRECRVMGVSQQDAPDVVQEVFRKVAANLPEFRHDRPGDSFRAWLATVARNAIRDFFKLQAGRPAAHGGSEMYRLVQDLPDLDATESTICAGPDSSSSIVRSAIAAIQDEFEPHTWSLLQTPYFRPLLSATTPDTLL